MRVSICLLLTGTLISLSNASILKADEPILAPAYNVLSGEELLFQDIASVFSASKFEQKITRAPSRISIITDDEIRQYGYRTLADILKSLPGFYTSNDRNYSYSGVRGFSFPGDYDTKILLLVDGHRLNDNIFHSIYTDRGFLLDLDLIERIEVIRGPGSALYGSNAFFAVINIISKSGRSLEGLELSGSAGSNESYQGRASYGRRHASGMELLLSGTYFASEGESRLYYPEFDDPATNFGIAQDMDDATAANLYAKVGYKDITFSAALAKTEKGIPTASYDTVFNDHRNRTWDNHGLLDVAYMAFSTWHTIACSARPLR